MSRERGRWFYGLVSFLSWNVQYYSEKKFYFKSLGACKRNASTFVKVLPNTLGELPCYLASSKAIDLIDKLRSRMFRIGTGKFYFLLKRSFTQQAIKLGRAGLVNWCDPFLVRQQWKSRVWRRKGRYCNPQIACPKVDRQFMDHKKMKIIYDHVKFLPYL